MGGTACGASCSSPIPNWGHRSSSAPRATGWRNVVSAPLNTMLSGNNGRNSEAISSSVMSHPPCPHVEASRQAERCLGEPGVHVGHVELARDQGIEGEPQRRCSTAAVRAAVGGSVVGGDPADHDGGCEDHHQYFKSRQWKAGCRIDTLAQLSIRVEEEVEAMLDQRIACHHDDQ